MRARRARAARASQSSGAGVPIDPSTGAAAATPRIVDGMLEGVVEHHEPAETVAQEHGRHALALVHQLHEAMKIVTVEGPPLHVPARPG